MSEYLAIDFGTSNCLAATISNERKLELIPLDGESPLLPSAIFIGRKDFSSIAIDPLEFERRVAEYKKGELERLKKDEASIVERLNLFYVDNRPRIKERPRSGEYYLVSAYNRALRRWKIDAAALLVATKHFEETQLKEEERKFRSYLKPLLTDPQIRKAVLNAMEREQFDLQIEGYWSQTFFSALNDRSGHPIFGSEAICNYSAEPMSGYFMQSPKAFLAIKLLRDHQDVFTRIITLVLRQIKERAERFTGRSFDGAVIGRPVNYMGSALGGSNEQALAIMREAARKAGFIEVRFVMEPLAAGLAISRTMFDTDHPALVVDIGGGTTDCAYIEVEPEAETKLRVIGVSGERVGGNDFDQSIAFCAIGPLIGRGAGNKNGRPIPQEIIHLALNTRDIYAQGKFRKAGTEIENILDDVSDSKPIDRLYEVFRCQMQHRLLLSAERMKIDLGSSEFSEQLLDYFFDPVLAKITHREFLECTDIEIKKVMSIVNAAIRSSEREDDSVRVFITGGMSYNAAVVEAIKATVPKGSTIQRIPAMESIVSGLALVARQLSLAHSIALEPEVVRGIPILH